MTELRIHRLSVVSDLTLKCHTLLMHFIGLSLPHLINTFDFRQFIFCFVGIECAIPCDSSGLLMTNVSGASSSREPCLSLFLHLFFHLFQLVECLKIGFQTLRARTVRISHI